MGLSLNMSSVLTFFAHPDDETILMGGTLALLARRGVAVHLMCLTRGEGGELGEPPVADRAGLGAAREQELVAAAQALGARSLTFLDYVDPTVGPGEALFAPEHDPVTLAGQIVNAIRQFEPEVVLTHGSNGEYGHPAHLAAHQAALAAVSALGADAPSLWTAAAAYRAHPYPRLSNLDDPADLIVDVHPALDAKEAAALAHRSQTALFVRRRSLAAGRPLAVRDVLLTEESFRCQQRGRAPDAFEVWLGDVSRRPEGTETVTVPESEIDFDSWWDYDHPDQSEARFRSLLAELPAESPIRLELLTQIARAKGLQRRFVEAHATLDEVEPRLPVGPTRILARYLLERGRVYNSSRRPAEARPLFERAWGVATAVDQDGLAIDAAHMLAIVSSGDDILDWNLRALNLAERSAQPAARKWLGSLLNNVGWTYHEAGRFAEALQCFERAAIWRRENGGGHAEQVARWSVARSLRSLGRHSEALELLTALEREFAGAAEPDGYVFEEIAENLLAQGEPAAARPYFARAAEVLGQDAHLIESEPGRLQRLNQLARIDDA